MCAFVYVAGYDFLSAPSTPRQGQHGHILKDTCHSAHHHRASCEYNWCGTHNYKLTEANLTINTTKALLIVCHRFIECNDQGLQSIIIGIMIPDNVRCLFIYAG